MFTKGNSNASNDTWGAACPVLLVERSEETRDLFAALFTAMGYEVKTFTTGTEALAHAPLFRPHAIFSSIFLPAQSGFDLCAGMRRMPATANALIVAITGHMAPDAAQLAQAAGFDRYLIKPVKLETILATMQALDGYRGKTPAAPSPAAANDRAGPHQPDPGSLTQPPL